MQGGAVPDYTSLMTRIIARGEALAGNPVFAVSARTGEGIGALPDHLESAAMGFRRPVVGGRFRLVIDRAFSLSGVGTVVTGTAHAGMVRDGDTLVISPAGFSARVRGLHIQDQEAAQGVAGERCAVALRGDFRKSDVKRGMWLVDPDLALPITRFHAELRVPSGHSPVVQNQSVHIHIGTDDIIGRVALLDRDDACEGTAALVGELLAEGAIAQSGTWLHLPDHRASLSDADRRAFDALRSLLDASPYTPPRVRDVANATGLAEGDVRALFKRIARTGELFPVAHDHYFTACAVAELAGIVRTLNDEEEAARAARFRDIIFPDGGGGRKAAIRILEFFDRVGYTRRVRDDNVLRAADGVQPWDAK
mgnify:CR=1 FL=1